MKPKRDVVCLLACSHRDAERALLWLRWAEWLSRQPGGDMSAERLVVCATQYVDMRVVDEMRAVCASPTFFQTVLTVADGGVSELGYPESATALFVHALAYAQKKFPNAATLFCEPDTTPMCPSWFADIKAEYAGKTEPFMGRLVRSTPQAINEYGFPEYHLMGNAVYGKGAFKLAPSLKTVMDTDRKMSPWPGLAPAWDLACAHDFVPQNEEPETIQQIWEPKPFTVATLNQIDPNTRLFHRDKSGGLIQALAQKHYPGFMDTLPKVDRFFMLDGYAHDIEVDGHVFSFVRCAKSVGGRYVHAKRPATTVEAERLTALSGRHGITEISEKDYESLLEQRRRNRLA